MPLQMVGAVQREVFGLLENGTVTRCCPPASVKAMTFCRKYAQLKWEPVVSMTKDSQRVVNGHTNERAAAKYNGLAHSKIEDGSGEELKMGSSGCKQDVTSMVTGNVNNIASNTSVALRSPREESATLHLATEIPTARGSKDTQDLQSKLLRVAVDVDEVLGSFLASLNKFIAEQHALTYGLSEYHVYDFMKIWGCSQAEANQRVHDFFQSEHFKDGIVPIVGAYRSLVHLAEFCDLVVVTSRQHVIRNQTLEWIERHYPEIFSDVYFGNHFALEGEARPKSEICRSIGAEVLIDDNPRYALECAQHGIEVLLFDHENSYPWSKTPDGPVHPLITRVQSWQEVELSLLAFAKEKR